VAAGEEDCEANRWRGVGAHGTGCSGGQAAGGASSEVSRGHPTGTPSLRWASPADTLHPSNPHPRPPDEAKALYEKLYAAILARNGQAEETAVHLARYLADFAEEVGGV
jgi:hypothetical protein